MFYRQRKQIPIYDSIYLEIIISDETDKLNKITEDNEDSYFAQVSKRYFKSTSVKGPSCFKKAVVVILNPNDKFTPITNKTMVHESIHIKNIVFKTIGYIQKGDNDEAEAYFTEWIFGELESFYNKVMLKENGRK